jgi:hypothetical protein
MLQLLNYQISQKLKLIGIGKFNLFFNMSTQEGGERFELVTSALLGVVPVD